MIYPSRFTGYNQGAALAGDAENAGGWGLGEAYMENLCAFHSVLQ